MTDKINNSTKTYYESGELESTENYVNGEYERKIEPKYNIIEDGKMIVMSNKEKFLISCMGDNLSNWKNNGFPACEIEIMLTDEEKEDLKNEYEYYEEDNTFNIGMSEGFGMDVIEEFSETECVLVWRCTVWDYDNKTIYHVRELKTFNTSNKYEKLNKVYVMKSPLSENTDELAEILSETEIEEFETEWDYSSDNKYNGFDMYSIKKFDLNEELKNTYPA